MVAFVLIGVLVGDPETEDPVSAAGEATYRSARGSPTNSKLPGARPKDAADLVLAGSLDETYEAIILGRQRENEGEIRRLYMVRHRALPRGVILYQRIWPTSGRTGH